MTINDVLSTFVLPTITEIYNLIITAKNYSPNDPLPLTITKLIASTLSPLFKIINDESMTYGTIPDLLKHSLFTPLLLTHSLMLSQLNYCNTLLTGQTKTILERLDAIINRSIRLIYKLKKYDYTTSITDLRLRLNWMTTANSFYYMTYDLYWLMTNHTT